ncbi:hypothetical protein BD779DRAFT_168279 [Infundibulicybe gibba]|nr:hypothetical protein BD779DRAFT_168279 [Infundibulicybe gibba]
MPPSLRQPSRRRQNTQQARNIKLQWKHHRGDYLHMALGWAGAGNRGGAVFYYRGRRLEIIVGALFCIRRGLEVMVGVSPPNLWPIYARHANPIGHENENGQDKYIPMDHHITLNSGLLEACPSESPVVVLEHIGSIESDHKNPIRRDPTRFLYPLTTLVKCW